MSSISRKEEIEAKRQKLLALRKQREQREQKVGGGYRAVSSMGGGLERSPIKEHQRSVSYSREAFSKASPTDLISPIDIPYNENGRHVAASSQSQQAQVSPTKRPVKPYSIQYVDVLVGSDVYHPTKSTEEKRDRIMYDKSVETEDMKILKEESDKEKEQLLMKELKSSISAEYESRKNALEEEKRQLIDRLNKLEQKNYLNDSKKEDSNSDDELSFLSLQNIIEDIQQEASEKSQLERRKMMIHYFEKTLKLLGTEFREVNSSHLDVLADENTNKGGTASTEVVEFTNKLTRKGENYIISQKRCYYNESMCKNRKVLDLQWSSQSPNLVAVSYSSPGVDEEKSDMVNASNDDNEFHTFSQSLVCIWNIASDGNVPECVFSAPTEITCICFNKMNDSILYGGGYNGKIYQWDSSNDNLFPVAISSNENSHFYPIYAIQHHHHKGQEAVISSGEKSGNTDNGVLVTASTDGTVCTWSPYSLLEPLYEPLHLKTPIAILSKYDELAPLCLGFVRENSKEYMVIGCEDGKIYHVNGYKSFNEKITSISSAHHKQYLINEESGIYEGHLDSPISGMDTSRNMFITSGFDWNIKIWEFSKHADRGLEENGSSYQFIKPKLVIEREDIIMDVKFCPLEHIQKMPGNNNYNLQFACVSGSGKLEFWDTRYSKTSPEVEFGAVFETDSATPVVQTKGLTKVDVSKVKTHQIATGSMEGYLNIFEVEPLPEK